MQAGSVTPELLQSLGHELSELVAEAKRRGGGAAAGGGATGATEGDDETWDDVSKRLQAKSLVEH